MTVYLSVAAAQFSTLEDYFLFTAEYAEHNFGVRLMLQFSLGAFLYLLFAMLLFRVVFSKANTSGAGAAGLIDRFGRLAILLSPAFAFAFLLFDASRIAGSGAWMMWLCGILIALIAAYQTFIVFAAFALSRRPEQMVGRPERKSRLLLAVSTIVVVALYTWIWADVIAATNFVGGIGIIILFLVCILLCLEATRWLGGRIRGFAGWLVAIVLVSHLVGGRSPEFTHTTVSLPEEASNATPRIEDFANKRGVPSVAVAFRDWIRSRPNGGKPSSPNQKYPVFIVAAQGGGQYAAYHTALSLARLYDKCPKLKNHVFAISAVSGGSVGAAMFSEMLRKSGTLDDRCAEKSEGRGAFENSVSRVFSHDFVTSVIATGLFFDVPALLIPQLRHLPDRARTLELALQHATGSGGAEPITQFYSSWSATGSTPALFFNATNSNYGRPILLSQLYMADRPSRGLFTNLLEITAKIFDRRPSDADEQTQAAVFQRIVVDGIRASEYNRPAYFNILQYRPDLQLPLTTASVLSARFPYVTPPGVLYSDRRKPAEDITLRETTGLQLIDGGFWDNSGIATAIEIIRQLKTANETKDLLANVEFHLISFGHGRAALQMEGTRDAQSELIAPIMTFEAVRGARRFRLADAKDGGFARVYNYELFDHAFQAPLSWTLSARIRREIEARSGGDVRPSLCCLLVLPVPSFLALQFPQILLNVEPLKQVVQPEEFSSLQKIGPLRLTAPNLRHFQDIIRAVEAGAEGAKPVAP